MTGTLSGIGLDQMWNALLNLLAAAILGGIIGAQRQATHKPAGFRTHLLVALGSCAFMEVSRLSGDSRIAAGVITGIGFLGAGAIVREGLQTRGLTTAASIWAVAAVGLALGFGTPAAYVLATATTILTFGALSVSDRGLDKVFPAREEVEIDVTFSLGEIGFEGVVALFTQRNVKVKRTDLVTIGREGEGGGRIAHWTLIGSGKHHRALRECIAEISAVPGVREISARPSLQV